MIRTGEGEEVKKTETYSEKVECPRCYDGKVDQRSKPATEQDEQDRDSSMEKHGVQRRPPCFVKLAKDCRKISFSTGSADNST